MSDLRAACEHGRYESHPDVHYEIQDGFARPIDGDYGKRCPGGREVTIDYEAGWMAQGRSMGLLNRRAIRSVVNAAVRIVATE